MSNATIENVIQKEGKGIFKTEGISMRPLIKSGRDTVLIEKCHGRLKKNDVALFKRINGDKVLHRIVGLKNNEYIFRGDNQFFTESGITDDMIIGKAVGIFRNDRYISFGSFRYILYTTFITLAYPLRKAIFYLKCKIKKSP